MEFLYFPTVAIQPALGSLGHLQVVICFMQFLAILHGDYHCFFSGQ